MRSAIFVTLLVSAAMATAASIDCVSESKPRYDLDNAPQLFEEFIINFNKTYTDEADKQVHYEAFRASLEEINRLNSDPKQTATFDINQFADMTDEERKQMRGVLVTEK